MLCCIHVHCLYIRGDWSAFHTSTSYMILLLIGTRYLVFIYILRSTRYIKNGTILVVALSWYFCSWSTTPLQTNPAHRGYPLYLPSSPQCTPWVYRLIAHIKGSAISQRHLVDFDRIRKHRTPPITLLLPHALAPGRRMRCFRRGDPRFDTRTMELPTAVT